MDLIFVGVAILVIAIILYVLGARGAAGMTASVGKLVLLVGVILFLVLLFFR